MTTSTKEYIEAREEWVAALKAKTIADADLEKARYRFQMARAELRAEETELLTEKVTI